MISALYVEDAVADHPKVTALKARYSRVPVIPCERYGEVFNPRSQNFRVQKQAPALIVAARHDGHVLPAPPGYGAGAGQSFYFSHMLNCLYDCRYCFLQGMYASAHYVLFVNYEQFEDAIDNTLREVSSASSNPGPVWFNSGYDGDSLALEPLSGFVEHFVPFFASRTGAILELRTKSTQIRTLLRMTPTENVVCAFSFTPEHISRELEHRVPAFTKRIDAMVQLQQAGWRIGVRFEPLIWCEDYEIQYKEMINQVLSALDTNRIDSVSIGSFRMPNAFFNKSRDLYPNAALFAGPLARNGQVTAYDAGLEAAMTQFCESRILEHIPAARFYHCRETD